jgi:hypothetical protein
MQMGALPLPGSCDGGSAGGALRESTSPFPVELPVLAATLFLRRVSIMLNSGGEEEGAWHGMVRVGAVD